MRQYNESSSVDRRVIVKRSAIEGQGGFASEPISQNEVVGIIGGTVMTEAEFQAFIATADRFDAIQIDEDLHLVDLSPNSRASNGSFNHSCDSNLWMQDEVTIVARRDILAGEELTVDYALFTVLPNWVLDQACQCSSFFCRHTVTGNDWLLADVQQRYKDHFSPFINQRIARFSGPS
jgi:hypothetical protein